MLKKRYENEDDIPEAARSFYTEDSSGAWVLGIDGDDAPAGGDLSKKLNQFRTSNREMAARLRELEQERERLVEERSAFGDSDPGTVKSALQLLNTVSDQADFELVKQGRIDEVVNKRLSPHKSSFEKQLAAEKARYAELEAKTNKANEVASAMVMEKRIRAAVAAKKLRMHASAEEDLMMRAKRDWRVGDDLDGDLVPAHDGNIADNAEAWIDMQVERAPHMWEGGSGGSARPGSIGSNGIRTIKRSEVSDRDYAKMMPDIASGKIKVQL